MAIAQPNATTTRNSPSHSALHRVIAADPDAPCQSLLVDILGNVGIGGTTTTPGAQLEIISTLITEIALIVQGASGQTANIFEVRDGTGTACLTIEADCDAVFSADVTISGVLNITGDVTTDGCFITGGATGVQMCGALGVLTVSSIGNTNNEDLAIDFETVANQVGISSSTGVDRLLMTAVALTVRDGSNTALDIQDDSSNSIFSVDTLNDSTTTLNASSDTARTPISIYQADRPADGDSIAMVQFFNQGVTPIAEIDVERGSTDLLGDLTINTGNSERFRIGEAGAITFNNAYTFPTADGAASTVLQTDGAGNLTFVAAGGSGGVGSSHFLLMGA
jgi:hypothetical protein